MEADFFALLASHAPLTLWVPAERITPTQYAQATGGPCLRYTRIDGSTGLHMQGSDGLSNTLMQLDVRGTDYSSVIAVRHILLGAHGVGGLLHPYRGVVGDTEFRLISLRSDRGMRFEKPDSVEYHTTSLDFDLWSRAA